MFSQVKTTVVIAKQYVPLTGTNSVVRAHLVFFSWDIGSTLSWASENCRGIPFLSLKGG